MFKNLSFVHSYLNYENIAWGNTTRTTLKKLASKQTLAIRVKNANEKMEELKVSNICKLNIYQVLIFMFKIKREIAPVAFWNDFR